MKTWHIKLRERKEIADRTYSFHFEKPADFSYHAGQYVSFSVEPPEIAAPGGTMREYSLSSAPYENELATALRFRESKPKQQFMQLRKGDPVYLQGPFGTFAFHSDAAPIVLLAGGIGMTPLLSMLKQALHERWENEFTVLFSNRRIEDIPFLPELQKIVRVNNNVKLVNSLTLDPATHWKEETGYITPKMIQKFITHPTAARYYISGPQRFVGGMWDVLDDLGISANRIHGEEFTGY